jgi:hypothetical protein
MTRGTAAGCATESEGRRDASNFMSDQARIRELLEEILETGRTPEEVCAEYPELLAQVRARWLQVRLVENELETLFPSSSVESAGAPQSSGQDTEKSRQMDGDRIFRRGRLKMWAHLLPRAALLVVLLGVLLGAIVAACLWWR